MSDRNAFLAAQIASEYPAWSISTMTIAGWTERLGELEPDVAERVAKRLRNLSSPPNPRDWQIAIVSERPTEYFQALPSGQTPEDRRTLAEAAKRIFGEWRASRRARGLPAPEAPFQIPEDPPLHVMEAHRREQLARLREAYPELQEVSRSREPMPESTDRRRLQVHHDEILNEVITAETAETGLRKITEPLGVTTPGLGYGQATDVVRDFAGWLFGLIEQAGYQVEFSPAEEGRAAV